MFPTWTRLRLESGNQLVTSKSLHLFKILLLGTLPVLVLNVQMCKSIVILAIKTIMIYKHGYWTLFPTCFLKPKGLHTLWTLFTKSLFSKLVFQNKRFCVLLELTFENRFSKPCLVISFAKTYLLVCSKWIVVDWVLNRSGFWDQLGMVSVSVSQASPTSIAL
jgi:hypothetical protein